MAPAVVGVSTGAALAIYEWLQAPFCVYPGRSCRVGHPHDCDFPPCPTHGSVEWLPLLVFVALAVGVTALVIAGISKLLSNR